MSLRFAILSLLTREALTGYDLTKRFESTVGFFWAAKHSQIYPELATLTRDGLVTFEVVTQSAKPNKKVYTLTEAGRTALAGWVADEAERRSARDPVLMRVWALGTIPPALAVSQLRALARELEDRMVQLQAFRATLPEAAGDPSPDGHLGVRLVLDFGDRHYQLYRDWIADALHHIEGLAVREAQG